MRSALQRNFVAASPLSNTRPQRAFAVRGHTYARAVFIGLREEGGGRGGHVSEVFRPQEGGSRVLGGAAGGEEKGDDQNRPEGEPRKAFGSTTLRGIPGPGGE